MNHLHLLHILKGKGKREFRPAAICAGTNPGLHTIILSTKFIYDGKRIVTMTPEWSHLDSKMNVFD
jgi:hypothetical protein